MEGRRRNGGEGGGGRHKHSTQPNFQWIVLRVYVDSLAVAL